MKDRSVSTSARYEPAVINLVMRKAEEVGGSEAGVR